MRLKFHHIGIAVKQIEPIAQLFSEKLGIIFEMPEAVSAQNVRVTFSEQLPSVELVEATSNKSPFFPMLPNPIKNFIDEKGEGLHHICYSVTDIEAAFEKFSGSGIKLIGKGIYTGSKGKRIFFIDPQETAGILIEIKEEKE